MPIAIHEEIFRFLTTKTDDPEIRARQKRMGELWLETMPEVTSEVFEKGLDEGLKPLVHQFERRLGRSLSSDERRALHERLLRLGADRLGDLVLDLAAQELAAWLADPDAR